MGIDVRLGTAQDVDVLAALLQATDRYYGDEGGRAPLDRYAVLARRALVGPDPCQVAIALLDGRAVAYATFAIVYPGDDLQGQLWLKELYSDERGRGVGDAILRFLARTATARGCTRVDWVAAVDNARGQAFYERLGARRLPRIVYRLDGERLRDLAGAGDR